MSTETQQKKVNLDLTEINGNAYALMGAFSRQAKSEGWSKPEIDAVITKCMESDYDHLLRTLIGVTEVRDDD